MMTKEVRENRLFWLTSEEADELEAGIISQVEQWLNCKKLITVIYEDDTGSRHALDWEFE
jgi:C4-type Zn-finger protein